MVSRGPLHENVLLCTCWLWTNISFNYWIDVLRKWSAETGVEKPGGPEKRRFSVDFFYVYTPHDSVLRAFLANIQNWTNAMFFVHFWCFGETSVPRSGKSWLRKAFVFIYCLFACDWKYGMQRWLYFSDVYTTGRSSVSVNGQSRYAQKR